MRLISFDALRTMNFPEHTYIKPTHFFAHTDAIRQADWLLFPEYWQLNPLIYGLKSRVFPSEATYRIGHDKIEMTRALMTVAPAHTPLTLIHGNTPYWQDEIRQMMPLPFVAKLTRSSMGMGVFLIENESQWRRYCEQTDVLYVQEYLPIDRDVRIVVVGDKILGGYWRLQSSDGFHNNVAQGARSR